MKDSKIAVMCFQLLDMRSYQKDILHGYGYLLEREGRPRLNMYFLSEKTDLGLLPF